MTHSADLRDRLDALDQKPPTPAYARADGWTNDLTGIGGARDKVSGTAFSPNGALSYGLLDQLFHNDDVSGKACDLLPRQCLREGFHLADQGLEDALEELEISSKIRLAWITARAFGGGALVAEGLSGDPTQPAVGKATSFRAVDILSLQPKTYYTTGEKLGEPQTYTFNSFNAGVVSNASVEIHESRIIKAPGALTLPRRRVALGYWDDSVLQRAYWIVQAYGLTWASIVHILQDVAQGVYAIKDLYNMLVSGNKELLLERMKVIDEQRSSARMILTDAEHEKFERVQTPITGVAELLDRVTERLASAFETPLTILMGSSPAGMNATGESDLEIWYAKCREHQRETVTPMLRKAARLIGAEKLGKVTYPPLWFPSAKEVAEERYIVAKAVKIYYDMGTVLPDEVRKSWQPDGWPSNGFQVDPNKPAGTAPALTLATQKAASQGAPGDKPVG